MTGRLLYWAGGTVIALVLFATLGTCWLVATGSGARWLMAQASPHFPPALSVEGVNGTLLRGLEFRNVGWQDPTTTVSVAGLATRFELMPLLKRELRVSALSIRKVDIAIGENPDRETDSKPFHVDVPFSLRLDDALIEDIRIATADNEFTIDTIQLGGRLSGSTLQLQHFDLRSGLADIAVSGEAYLSGDFPLEATAGWQLRRPDQPPLSGVLQLQGNTTQYEIEQRLDAPYAVVTQGTVAIVNEGISLNLDNRWKQIDIAEGNAPAIALLDGALQLTGTIDRLEFDGATSLSSADIPMTSVQTRGIYAGERLKFELLSVVNDWGQLLADGAVQLEGGPSWSFNLALSELDPAVADARLQGRLEVVGTTSGHLVKNKPGLALELAMDRISGELNRYPVNGNGLLSYANDRLQFDDTVIVVGDNRINFNGHYGPGLQVDARARLSDLGQLGLGIAGELNGDFQIVAELDRVAASGYLSGEDLAWNNHAVDRLSAKVALPATGDGTVSLQIDMAEHGSLAASFAGRLDDGHWFGTINNLAVRREPAGEWTLQKPSGFSVSRAGFDLDTACLGTVSTGGRACFKAKYDLSGPLKFETNISGLPVAALPRYLPPGASVLGEINAEANGDFEDGRLNANARFQIDGLGLIATVDGEDVSASFEKARANIDVADNEFVGEFEFKLEDSGDHASGKMEIADLFDRHSMLNGRGDLALADLRLVSFFVPDVANPLGTVAGSIEATGSLMAPEISGDISLRDGAADIRRTGISITEIGLILRQSKRGELSLQGSAKSGDGYLQVSGETMFGADTGIRSEVRLIGKDFRLMRLPDWQVTASPAITVLFDESRTEVSGELGIPEAHIVVKTVPETTEKPSADAVIHRGDGATIQARRMLSVDVTTMLGADVSFSGFGLSTELQGSVRISGDSESPYNAFGRVVLREGRYQAYGQNLAIESGELIFNGPLGNPALNVRATRTASDKTVTGIHLTGTPTQLRSQVYSEPPLSDAESLSYLLTGRPLSSANSEEGDMLNQAAFALGLTTAGSVASRIRNQLGLDTLGIQGGAGNRQLVAGKRVSDRLLIEYAYGVVDSLGTLLLRYQLSRRLMVESRSGSVRNVDVVYSVKKP